MMRQFLIMIFFVVGVSSAYSKPTSTTEHRLLRELIMIDPALKDSTRLEILDKLTRISRSYVKKRVKYTDMLLKEAQLQENKFYLCKAYWYNISIAYYNFDVDTANYWMGQLEPIARKYKYYDLLFQGRQIVVDMLSLQEDFELEEYEASLMLHEATELNNQVGIISAYQALGNVYLSTYRYKEAINFFEKAYDIALAQNEKLTVIDISNRLIDIYLFFNDTENQLKYIRISESTINSIIEADPDEVDSYRHALLIVNISYLNYYRSLGQLDMAAKYLILSKYYACNDYYFYELYYRLAHCDYYSITKQYDKAIAELDTLIPKPETEAVMANLLSLDKANLLLALHRNSEALDLYKTIWPKKDSISESILLKQITRLKTDYNADVLILESEKIRQVTSLALFISVSVITCIFAFFAFSAGRKRKQLRKDELEIIKANKEIDLANMAKERFLSNIKTAICTPLNAVVEDSLLLSTDDNSMNSDQRKDISSSITRTSAELMQLINNILDLSRMEAGMMKFSVNSNGLFLLLCEVTVELELRGVKIAMNVSEDNESCIDIDIAKFRSVLQTMTSKEQSSPVEMEFSTIDNDQVLQIKVYGSKLALADQSQDIIITNEINRMLVEYFKGSYIIIHPTEIVIKLPTSPPQADSTIN